jgi:hypothetical protein
MYINVLGLLLITVDIIFALTAVDSTYVPNGPLVKCSFL